MPKLHLNQRPHLTSGAESKVTRAQVAAALGSLADCVEAFKVRAAFREFRIVRQKNESLWA
jgi:hypothetical protein